MKVEFTIEDKTYELPEFVNVEQYAKIYKLKDVLSDEYFAVKLINALSGCPIEDLLQVNYQQIEHLAVYCLNLFPKQKEKFVDRFELDGVQYGFLDSWKKFSFSEWVDLDTLITKNVDELVDNIHIILAIMYRPIISEDKKTKKYKIEKYNSDTMIERAELFKKNLDVRIYFGTLVFFSQFVTKYISPTQQSLQKMSLWSQMKLVWRYRKIIKLLLRENGDGTSLSTELLTQILQSTISSYKKPWWKFSIRFPSWLRKKPKK